MAGKNNEPTYILSDRPGVINPYTFIPLEEEPVEREDAEQYYEKKDKLLTGVLHCRLLTQTPLAIPDTEKVEKELIKTKSNQSESEGKSPRDDDKHYKYPFYRIGGDIAIPGSTIRGELRSVYETMTNSCFPELKDDLNIHRREENRNAYKPGILKIENGKYVLYSAKRYLIPISDYATLNISDGNKVEKTDIDKVKLFDISEVDGKRQININGIYHNGDKIKFNYVDIDYKKNNNNIWEGIVIEQKSNHDPIEGILYLGERFKRKHGESIFVQDNLVQIRENELEEAYKKLLKTKDYYRDTSVNKNFVKDHTGYSEFEDLKLENGIPLWYNYADGKIYLSYASIGRIMYYNTLNDLVESRKACKDRKKLCPACLLFGMIGDKESTDESNKLPQGLGSRIRVTDASLTNKSGNVKSQFVTLKELGSPHISYLPFYARMKDDNRKDENPKSYDNKDVTISGRKFYWHHAKAGNPEFESDFRAENGAKTIRNSTMEVVEPGAEFEFDIFYDGIKESQLKELKWAVTFGENREEGQLCHKLGHGKPLGLGSVKIVIDSDQRRTFSEGQYSVKTTIASDLDITYTDSAKITRLKRVADMKALDSELERELVIDYPDILDEGDQRIPLKEQQGKSENKKARHQWYSQNKKRKQWQKLPLIDSDNQELKFYKLNPQKNNADESNHLDGQKQKFHSNPSKGGVKIEVGEKYEACITGYNDKNTIVYIEIEGSHQWGSIYFKEVGAEYGKVNEDPRFKQVGSKLLVKCSSSQEVNNKTRYNFVPVDE